MKLASFRTLDHLVLFGVVVQERILSLESILRKKGIEVPFLKNVGLYLENLPESEWVARELFHYAEENAAHFDRRELWNLDEVRILSPVPVPPALIDFGLSPRHLRNSLKTLLKYEFPVWVRPLIQKFVEVGLRKKKLEGILPYYKGNPHSVLGDGEEAGWPAYSAYLDIEPELAIVAGNEKQPIAGYTILNDWSARDVQWPEMFGTGPARSKDFDRGNGVGPFLVTPDEISDPLSLHVTVKIHDRWIWEGSTSEYSHSPEEVIQYLRSIFTPSPGTIIGMGTIPDCCGLDRDQWIEPGDPIAITIERLGTLHQRVPRRPVDLSAFRWKRRAKF